jgi:hypothetical protein
MKRWAIKPNSWAQRCGNPCSGPTGPTPVPVSPFPRLNANSAPTPQCPAAPKSKSAKRHRPAAASLPDAAPEIQSVLTAAAAQLRSLRPGAEALASIDRITCMAARLQAGRKLQPLLRLMASGLFQSATAMGIDDGCLQPSAGLTANLAGEIVLILSKFSFRGQFRCDVAPLFPRQGPRGSTHTFNNSSLKTCFAADLADVDFVYRVVCVKKKRTWLQQSDADKSVAEVHEALLSAKHRLEALQPPQPCQENAQGEPRAVTSRTGITMVTPAAATLHAESQHHRVRPREALYGVSSKKASVVWDVPWPVELDVRPWRCLSCKCRPGSSGTQYFPSLPADVIAAVPGTLVHHGGKDSGTLYFSSRFLMQVFVSLYETMNFRATRRRLIDLLLANALTSLQPQNAGLRGRLGVLLEAFPTAAQLRAVALQAFPDVIRQRIQEQQRLQFIYNGQSVRPLLSASKLSSSVSIEFVIKRLLMNGQ